jgi:hypothetical protein
MVLRTSTVVSEVGREDVLALSPVLATANLAPLGVSAVARAHESLLPRALDPLRPPPGLVHPDASRNGPQSSSPAL